MALRKDGLPPVRHVNINFNSDKEMVTAAIMCLREFEATNVSPHLYDMAVREGVSVEGFVRGFRKKIRPKLKAKWRRPLKVYDDKAAKHPDCKCASCCVEMRGKKGRGFKCILKGGTGGRIDCRCRKCAPNLKRKRGRQMKCRAQVRDGNGVMKLDRGSPNNSSTNENIQMGIEPSSNIFNGCRKDASEQIVSAASAETDLASSSFVKQ